MQLTSEQQDIINYALENDGYISVNAVAGAGKTSLLVELTKALKPQRALYLAYNRAIAVEASRKFPKSVTCCTTHSLAFKPTVTANRLSLGKFTYRNINTDIPYERRCELVDIIKEYFLSSYIHFSDFIEKEEVPIIKYEIALLESYISQMESGDMECTHEFYLKYFHILLATGHVTYDEFDFLALDEAGDVNPVTLEIVKLLPAKKKILVGDSRQNIYSFNHTINCFQVMKGHGQEFPMSQSFRVSPEIAARIDTFCKAYIDPKMKFIGTPQKDSIINTRAIISRTNTALISKMIELNAARTPYTLTRSADDIFSLPKALCFLKHKGIMPPDYKYIQEDVNDYFENSDIRKEYKTVLSYLKELYKEDVQVGTAISLVLKYKTAGILSCYEEAKKHEKYRTTLYLGTSHSTKGLEFDEVYIMDDLNQTVAKLQYHMGFNDLSYDDLSSDEQSELNLYYVACSRAHKVLLNATQLEYTYTPINGSIRGALFGDLADYADGNVYDDYQPFDLTSNTKGNFRASLISCM